MTRLAISGIGKTYADGTEALRGIDVSAESGEIVAILGGSGCGKTTLLRLVAGLDEPSTGSIRLEGDVSAVFQEPRLLPWLSVGANIAFGGQRLEPAERERRVSSLLERIGLGGFAKRWPRDLSGGQQQRVAIARALIGHPGLLLFDEPFSALDPFTRATQHRLVLDLWRDLRPTIMMVTHDIDEAVFLADRIVIMRSHPGRVQEAMTVEPPRSVERPRDRLAPAFDLMKRRVMRAIDRSLAEDRPRNAAGLSADGLGNVSPWV